MVIATYPVISCSTAIVISGTIVAPLMGQIMVMAAAIRSPISAYFPAQPDIR